MHRHTALSPGRQPRCASDTDTRIRQWPSARAEPVRFDAPAVHLRACRVDGVPSDGTELRVPAAASSPGISACQTQSGQSQPVTSLHRASLGAVVRCLDEGHLGHHCAVGLQVRDTCVRTATVRVGHVRSHRHCQGQARACLFASPLF